MNKRGLSGIGIFFIILLLGAGFIWAYSKDFKFGFLDKNNTNSTNFTDFENETVCKACQEFPDIEQAAYYFDNDTYKGFNALLDNTDQFIYCGLQKLDNKEMASRFIALKNVGVDVKINFGIVDTMVSCEVTCVPKLESQYTYLLGEGIDVSYSRLNYNFCINEKAVYIFSLVPGENPTGDNGLILFNHDLRRAYGEYFQKISS